jgi:hypothetical protein
MSAALAVVRRLELIGAVTAIVQSRIYQVKLPQKPVLPAIRVQRIGTDEFMHLRGVNRLMRARVQVDSVASEAYAADPVTASTALDAALHGTGNGTALGGWRGTVGGITVTGILPAGLREGYDAQQLEQFKVMRDYYVWFYG